MAGQNAGKGLDVVHGNIAQICERGGVSADETSAIGGMGRKGSDGYGKTEMAPHHDIRKEFMNDVNGHNASTGQTGYNSDVHHGHTFGK